MFLEAPVCRLQTSTTSASPNTASQTIKTLHPSIYPHLQQESCQWRSLHSSGVAFAGVESARKFGPGACVDKIPLQHIPSICFLHHTEHAETHARCDFLFVSLLFHVPERVAAPAACVRPKAAFPRSAPSFRREASPHIVFFASSSAQYLRFAASHGSL